MVRKITIAIAVMGVFWAGGLFPSMTYGEVGGHLIANREHDNKAAISHASTAGPAHKVETVWNRLCPVSGEEIDEKTKLTYEYKGKT